MARTQRAAALPALAVLALASLLSVAAPQTLIGDAPPTPSPPADTAPAACALAPLQFTAPAIMNGGWYMWYQFRFDTTANYVWHSPNAIVDAAVGDAWYVTTLSLSAPVVGTVAATADDEIEVYFNGTRALSYDNWRFFGLVGYQLPAGETLVELHVTNNGGPAGAIFSLKSQADNSVLLNTGEQNLAQWGWTPTRCDAGAQLVYGAAAASADDCFSMPEADFPMHPVEWVAASQSDLWVDFAVDADAAWMWYLPDAATDVPYGQAYYYATVTVASATPATAYFSADNQGDLYVNGLFVGTNANAGAISTASVSLTAGSNIIVLRATNWGGPAGVIFSLADGRSGATLLNTGNASQPLWAWSPCAGSLGAGGVAVAGTVAPLVPPPPAVDCSAFEPAEYPYSTPFYTASGSMSGSFFAWSGGVAAVDPTAAYVWSTPGAIADAPVATSYYNASVTVPALTRVTIYASADNDVAVFLNGLFVGANSDWSTTATLSATLLAGVNTVDLRARNWGGSAGLIMSMLDEEGTLLLNTGSPAFLASWSVSPCSVLFPPAPPPPAFAPAPPGEGSAPYSVACTADTPRASVYLTAPAHSTGSGLAWADFSVVDASAAWLWNTANAVAGAPSAQAYFSATLTLADDADVLLSFAADNSAEVSLNGSVVASVANWSKVSTVAASLPAGATPLSVRAVNWGGPAGLILTVRHALTGAVLLNTGAANASAWSWCGAALTVDTLEVSTQLSALTQGGGALSANATAALAGAISAATGVDADNVFVGGAAYASGVPPAAVVAGNPPAAMFGPPPAGNPPTPPPPGGASTPSAAGRRRRLLDVTLPIVISGLGSNESAAQAVAAVLGSPTTLMRLAAAAGVSSVRLSTQPSVSARVASTASPPVVAAPVLAAQPPAAQTAAASPPPAADTANKPPPPAAAPTVVAASMTLAGLTATQFTPAAQTAFVSALAAQLDVATSAITITGVTAAATGRHLLQTGITVAFTVAAPSSAAVATISAAIAAAPASSVFTTALNTQLVAAGAPATTGVVVAAQPVTFTAAAAAPRAADTPSHAVAAATPAFAVLLGVVLALVQ